VERGCWQGQGKFEQALILTTPARAHLSSSSLLLAPLTPQAPSNTPPRIIGRPPWRRMIGIPSATTVPVRREKSIEVSFQWRTDCFRTRPIHAIQRDETAVGITCRDTDLCFELACFGDGTLYDPMGFCEGHSHVRISSAFGQHEFRLSAVAQFVKTLGYHKRLQYRGMMMPPRSSHQL